MMEQNTEQEKQIPKPKKKMSNFGKAFLWTAIPIIVFTAISMPGAMAPHTAWTGFGVFGGTAFGLWVLAIPLCVGFAVARKRLIALGLLAGIGIGILCLVLFIVVTIVTKGNRPTPPTPGIDIMPWC